MPLSKAKDRERWHRRKLQPNSNLDLKQPLQPNSLRALQPKLGAAGLKLEGNKIVGVVKPMSNLTVRPVPLYNPSIHKPGDRVMVRSPYNKKLIETVIPEIDADGNPIA